MSLSSQNPRDSTYLNIRFLRQDGRQRQENAQKLQPASLAHAVMGNKEILSPTKWKVTAGTKAVP